MEKPNSSALECDICHEFFESQGERRPMLLLCGHSFCLACLRCLASKKDESLKQKDKTTIKVMKADQQEEKKEEAEEDRKKHGEVACPFKCAPTPLQEGKSVEQSLTTNFALVNQLDLLRSLFEEGATTAANATPSCEECTERTAEIYCANCEAGLCAECNAELHSRRVTQSHQRMSISERPLAAAVATCQEHPCYGLDLYCENDQSIICLLCEKSGAHHGHTVVLRSAKEELARTDLRSAHQRLQLLRERLRGAEGEEEARLLAVAQRWNEVDAAIREHFAEVMDRVRAALEARRDRLQRQAAGWRERKETALHKARHELAVALSEVEVLAEEAERAATLTTDGKKLMERGRAVQAMLVEAEKKVETRLADLASREQEKEALGRGLHLQLGEGFADQMATMVEAHGSLGEVAAPGFVGLADEDGGRVVRWEQKTESDQEETIEYQVEKRLKKQEGEGDGGERWEEIYRGEKDRMKVGEKENGHELRVRGRSREHGWSVWSAPFLLSLPRPKETRCCMRFDEVSRGWGY